MRISAEGDRPGHWYTFIRGVRAALAFNRAGRLLRLGSEPPVPLHSVFCCRLESERVLRWSSDEIVEDYKVDFALLGSQHESVLELHFSPYDGPGFNQVQQELAKLAAEWNWPLQKLERRFDNIESRRTRGQDAPRRGCSGSSAPAGLEDWDQKKRR